MQVTIRIKDHELKLLERLLLQTKFTRPAQRGLGQYALSPVTMTNDSDRRTAEHLNRLGLVTREQLDGFEASSDNPREQGWSLTSRAITLLLEI